MKEMVSNVFSSFDLFRNPVKFYFKGKTQNYSCFGFLFSFCIYGFIIFIFAQSDIFEKKSPIVVSQSLKKRAADKIEFNKNRLISFMVSDSTKRQYVDPSIFYLMFKYYLNATYFEYKDLKPCSLDDVAFNESLYINIGLNNGYCLENKSFNLEGSWEENHISYIAVSLFLCDNITRNGTCKSQEEINSFFDKWGSSKFFAVQYHDTETDLYDYESPFKITYRSDYQFVDTSVKKRFYIFLKSAYVTTDDGWIFPSKKIDSNIMFDTKDFDFQIRTDKTQPVFQFLFQASKSEAKCTRRYQKLPEILGSMAGMINLVMLICSMVTNLVNYVSTLKYVINKLYFFPDIITNNEKLKKAQGKNYKITNNKNQKNKSKFKQKDKDKDPTIKNSIQNSFAKRKTSNFEISLQNQTRVNSLPQNPFNIRRYSKAQGINFKNPVPISNKSSLIYFNHDPETSNSENQINTKDIEIIIPDQALLGLQKKHTTSQIFNDRKSDSISLKHFSDEKKKESNKNKLIYRKPFNSLTKSRTLEPKFQNSANLLDFKYKIDERTRKMKQFKNFIKKKKPIDSMHSEKNNKNQLKLSCFQYLIFIFCSLFFSKKSPQHQVISKAEKAYKKDMDIVSIVTKLHDVEKLKILLLDEDQLLLFKYLSKSIITPDDVSNCECETLNPSQKKMMSLINSQKENGAFNKIEEAYKKIIATKEVDKINCKLIELFDERVCNLTSKQSL